MFDFDPVNSKEAENQQRMLIEAIASFKYSFATLKDRADDLYELRAGASSKTIREVEELVNRFTHQPQVFPKTFKEFWSAEERLHAGQSADKALKAAAAIAPESVASALGLTLGDVRSTFLASAMLTSVGTPGVHTLLATLGRPAISLGIGPSAISSVAGFLGSGLAGRAAVAPAVAVPVLGQILGAGLLAWSAWGLWDTAKKNAAIADELAKARTKIGKEEQAIRTQTEYVRRLISSTEKLIRGMRKDLRWFKALESLPRDFRELDVEAQERLASLVNLVLVLAELMGKTATDTMAEAQNEAVKRAAA